MRRLLLQFLPLIALVIIALFGRSFAQQAAAPPSQNDASKANKLKIIPLVTLQPGESKELLLSTWCTVGITRGGGFSLLEMQNGKPSGGGEKSYSRGGVTISVPNFEEAEKFASAAKYVKLLENDIDPFIVTITASNDAKPELYEMHLVDATCSGHCKTDFRVLVTAR